MTVAAGSEPIVGGGSTGAFYALVKELMTGLFSHKVDSIRVEVLSGTLAKGDRIELVRPDGSSILAVAKSLVETKVMGDRNEWVHLDQPLGRKQDVGPIDIVRSADLAGPVPSPEELQAGGQLLEAIQAARERGFPNDPAEPSINATNPSVSSLCERFRTLPDEAVLILVQRRLRKAVEDPGGPFDMLPTCSVAAAHLEAIGLREDGDRLVLAAAAALQGHKVSPSTRALASVVATGALAAEKATKSATSAAKGLSWALGMEMGDGFAVGYKSGISLQGEVREVRLVEAGRAVAIGACDRCRAVVKLGLIDDWGNKKLGCPAHGKKVGEQLIVVPSDEAAATQELRARHADWSATPLPAGPSGWQVPPKGGR